MIRVRPYRESDLEPLMALAARRCEALGMPFELIDPRDPNTFITLLAEDVEDERLVAALSGRTVAEGFLTLDGAWGGPREQWGLLRHLFACGSAVAQRAGFKEIAAGIPRGLEPYGRRLCRELGFIVDNRSRLFLQLSERPGSGGEP